jgi:hypothetical protein
MVRNAPPQIIVGFMFFSKGGLNNQTLDEAGDEADLDVQFAFGLSHPIAVSPPRFISYNSCT